MARTQQQRREETRARLLDAAIDTIVEIGYARASAAVIARRAQVSDGALFKHFATMGDFMGAVTLEVMQGEGGLPFVEGVATEIKVAGHLLGQRTKIGDHFARGVGGGQNAQLVVHGGAELVNGHQPRAVETRDGRLEPVAGQARLGRHGGLDQVVAHPGPQLARGVAAEGDHEQPVDGGVTLTEQPHGQRRHRMGLAGAGGRLEHHRARW